MADIVTLAAGGIVAGSIYLLIKNMNQRLNDLDKYHNHIKYLKDDIRNRRYRASKLKKMLMKAHDESFEAWKDLKNTAQKIYKSLERVSNAIKSNRYRGKKLQNLRNTHNKLAKELRKATNMKRKAHSKWDRIRDDYLSAKRTLSSLY